MCNLRIKCIEYNCFWLAINEFLGFILLIYISKIFLFYLIIILIYILNI